MAVEPVFGKLVIDLRQQPLPSSESMYSFSLSPSLVAATRYP